MTDDAAPSAGDRRPAASALLGPALALPVLAAVAVGARASRPPVASDGVWTTPIQILLGVVGLGMVVGLVVLVRVLPGRIPQADRGSDSRRNWTWLLGATGIAILVWLARVGPEPDEASPGVVDLGPFGADPGTATALPTTTTAVVAGLAALGLLTAATVVLWRRGSPGPGGRTHHAVGAPAGSRSPSAGLPDGPPDAVVMAAWAAARDEVAAWLDVREHDPPGRLLRQAAGTSAAPPLRTLTALYLPVRYGRSTASDVDAAAARTALDDLRQRRRDATGAP